MSSAQKSSLKTKVSLAQQKEEEKTQQLQKEILKNI
jgi:hypothetical protein